jgi:hypothetical protein
LAITLVIATNQAFKGKRKDEVTIHDTIHDTIQVTVQETDQVEPVIVEKIVEVPIEVIKEVEKIVEVPVYIEKEVLPVDEYFEREDLTDLQEIKQEVEEVIKNNEEIINEVIQTEPKRLSYTNRNGGSFKIDRL